MATTTEPKTRKRGTAARKRPEQEPLPGPELDDPPALADPPAAVLEPSVVIAPELQFTTPKKHRPVTEDKPLPFSIDGAVYTIIAPAKLEEALAPLIAAGARAANESDVLFAGANFLQKVLAPESLIRINARLNDPADDFTLVDLFDKLERIAVYLVRTAPKAEGAGAPVPARRRVGR